MRGVWLTALVLAACTTGKEEAFDKGAMLRSVVDEVILPTHEGWIDDAHALDAAADALCAGPTTGGLQAARDAWPPLMEGLWRQQAWAFGPARNFDIDLPHNVHEWPADAAGVDAILAGEAVIDASFVAGLAADDHLRGPAAVEYLLWGAGDVTSGDFGERRCAYLLATIDVFLPVLEDYEAAWRPDGEAYGEALATAGDGSVIYPTDQDAITAIVSGLLTVLEDMEARKLGKPLGDEDEGVVQPDQVESPYAKRSLLALKRNLEGVEAIYDGGSVSLSDYVLSREKAGEVDAIVRTALTGARLSLEAMDDTLASMVQSDPAVVREAQTAVEGVSIALSGEVSTLLGVNPTAVEGDND